MKKLGVIGGMGPEATSYYYEQVIRHTEASCDQEHLEMVILSHAGMPDRTNAILTGNTTQLLADMAVCTEALEHLGCGRIAIPCNTSHYFYDDIQKTTAVPIIHMPRETVRYAVAGAHRSFDGFSPSRGSIPAPVRTIGIMGTDGTIQSGVYARECERLGIEPISPSAQRQRDVMSLIYDDIKAGKDPDFDKFDRVMREFEQHGCDRVILACTELSVLAKYRYMPPITLDAMDVLVRESVIQCGASYRP